MTDLRTRISDIAESMEAISLEEMDSIRLMNRLDTKFVTSLERLEQILQAAAAEGYKACEIEGERVLGYNSMYFDTEDLGMYTAHHNGRLVRQKVRTRTYLISGITYLEIKRKNNHGRTKKKRTQIPTEAFLDFGSIPEAAAYLAGHSWYTAEMLSPACTTAFKRITLVNKAKTERLTIDMDLKFTNPRTGREAGLEDAVIIELKQDGRAASEMKKILLNQRVHPFRVSKYCIGTALTSPSAKNNRFRMKVRRINKITGNKIAI